MQVIIPLAGKGTRLRPHTHLVPKPLLKVAGRPVMDWVMDRLEGLDVTELIFITGHLKEQVETFARSRYRTPSRFIEQKVQDGTAGAVNLARPYVKGPVLIIFVDTVFEADLTLINRTDADGIIWAKEVEDYQRFGVVVTDAKGYMTRIVEKPSTPISKLANIGLYYIRAVDSLWKGIDHVLATSANKGEWYLTDAFQWMIEHGKRILTAEVGGWYDCGKLDSLLETNEILLRKGAARRVEFPGVKIHDPVYIEDGVTIEKSEIGPNVSLEQGTRVTGSRLKNTIVGRNARLNSVVLDGSLLGNGVQVDGLQGSMTVGDDSEVSAKRSSRAIPERSEGERRISLSQVDDLCRSYLDLKYHFDPAAASAAGRVELDARLGSFDPETTRGHLAALRSIGGAAEELEPAELPDEIDRTALLGEIRTTLSRLEHEQPNVRNPSFWLAHLFQGLYAVLARTEPEPAARVPAVVARLNAAPAFLDGARATLEEPPSVFVDTAIGMLGGGGELIAQVVSVFGRAAPHLSGELAQAGEAALRALVGFGAVLRDEMERNPNPHAFAIGEEQFTRRLYHEHALGSGPSELWRYGTHLQDEVTQEIVVLARRLDHRPWRDLVNELQDDTPPDDQLLTVYRSELDAACAFVSDRDLVGVPEGGVDVVPTPAFLKALVPFAAYDPPPIHLAQRTGRFYVTEPDPSQPPEIRARQRRGHCRHSIPAMVSHEAYPGHHLQLLTAQGLGSEVRRHIWSPVMVEGWALYSEQLMDEIGFYRTEEARLFRLLNLLWRAIRVVLDVGLHTRGMTPAEAVDYLVEHLPIERPSAEAEVRRYCAWPTYQLSYAIGRRELLRLRDAYRERDPAGYSPRKFHDEVMRYGGLPVALARWGMDLAE